jgi:hypothetical protein
MYPIILVFFFLILLNSYQVWYLTREKERKRASERKRDEQQLALNNKNRKVKSTIKLS